MASFDAGPYGHSIEAAGLQAYARYFPEEGSFFLEAGIGALAFHTLYSSEVVIERSRLGVLPGGHVGIGIAAPWPLTLRPTFGLMMETLLHLPVAVSLTVTLDIVTGRTEAG
jgi:hypothetical protein